MQTDIETVCKSAMDCLEEAICLCSLSGNILYLNHAAKSLLGMPDNEVLGMSCRQIFGDLFAESLESLELNGNKMRRGELELSGRILEYSISFWQDLEGQCGYIVSLVESRPSAAVADDLRSEDDSRKRDRILAGAALATNQLLITGEVDRTLNQALEILGCSANVDWAYIYEHNLDEGGKHSFLLRYEWVMDTALPNTNSSDSNVSCVRLPPEWYESLSGGMPLRGLATNQLPAIKRQLEEMGVLSFLIVPIFASDRFWGFIGFSDCQRERIWSWGEVSILMTMASAAGGFISRLKAEDALRETSDYLENLFGHANAPIIVWDPSFRITRFNHAFERLTGRMAEDVLNRPLGILFPGDSRAESMARIERTQSGESWDVVEIPILHRDGSVRTVLWNSAAIYDEEGQKVLATIAQGQDITERIHAQEKVLFQASLLDQVRNAVIATDLTGRITYWNRFSEVLYQWKSEEMIGSSISETIVPENMGDCMRTVMADIYRDGFLECELPVRRKDGSTFPALYIFNILKDLQGKIIGFVGVSTDLTERKRAEQDLLLAKEKAESATKAKSEFLANMSHEIRTPMNAVIGLTGLLLNTNIDSQQRDYIETIRSSGDSLLTIISDILDFSKIEGGMMDLEMEPFSLQECLEASLSLVSEAAARKGLTVAETVDPNVPHRIVGDLTRLWQILVNLLSNAVKFTEKGEVIIRVSSRPMKEWHEIQFEVRDSGIGISRDLMGRLFQSFSQVDASTTRKYGGTGLGLAICRHLVELMGGRIWAESEPGAGSVFYFSIPAEASGDSMPLKPYATYAMPSAASASAVGMPLRILLAEDNLVNQKVAMLMLERQGFRADVAATGIEVLAALQSIPYDVVLMDVQMPEMDGLDATRRIRNSPGRQPYIIAMTAHAMKGDREECLEAGMNDYVSKPVRIDELLKAIERSYSHAADD
ncbi:Methyl sulfide methyltransferase-associated sensor [uncultured archaeon]|nr:Methyl sulfide methyltransferase-associated sensor [uncultured archaeon]